MFEVSWGELAVVTGLGLFLIGRQDLPRAAHMLGLQVGRAVGLLQGARARADRFTANNELRQLQNELRSGLRELDAVKSELAVSMSTRGMMGRELGATVPSANRQNMQPPATALSSSPVTSMNRPSSGLSVTATQTGMGPLSRTTEPPSPIQSTNDSQETAPAEKQHYKTMIAAVAEEEWRKQGTHFSSRAEQGSGIMGGDVEKTGSAMLAGLLRQNLVFDQYDRVVQEQDDALQSKVSSIIQKQQKKQQNDDTSKK